MLIGFCEESRASDVGGDVGGDVGEIYTFVTNILHQRLVSNIRKSFHQHTFFTTYLTNITAVVLT